jgi:ribosomal protein S27E
MFCSKVFRVCGAKLSWRFAGQMVHASSAHTKLDVYRQRKPQRNPLTTVVSKAYYRCVEDCFETFEQVYQERFEQKYGFFRPYVRQVIYRYLDCGILKNGFARVRCEDCGHEYLLAHSCQRRHFCPSCHQKRVVEFGEWLCQEVVKAVPHRHVVLSIPKILWRYFLYDRKLLFDLSRCGWEALKVFYTNGVRDSKAVPGAVVAIQTFGDFPQGFHPHLHILASDGCFHGNGMFSVSPTADTKALEQIFRHKVLKMLLAEEKITQDMIMLLDKWRHTGFNVFFGPRILPRQEKSMEKIPCFLEPELTGKTSRRNWARLIQKIYEVDPLVCPKCFGAMHIIADNVRNPGAGSPPLRRNTAHTVTTAGLLMPASV